MDQRKHAFGNADLVSMKELGNVDYSTKTRDKS